MCFDNFALIFDLDHEGGHYIILDHKNGPVLPHPMRVKSGADRTPSARASARGRVDRR